VAAPRPFPTRASSRRQRVSVAFRAHHQPYLCRKWGMSGNFWDSEIAMSSELIADSLNTVLTVSQNKALTGLRASIPAAKLGQAVQKRLFLRLPSAQVSDSGSRLRAHVCHESVTERDSDKKTNGRGARPQKNCSLVLN